MKSDPSTEKNVAKADDASNQRGLACPKCGCRHLYVIYTRIAAGLHPSPGRGLQEARAPWNGLISACSDS